MYLPQSFVEYSKRTPESVRGYYAPPLSAFSPETPGGNPHELEYIIEANSQQRLNLTTPLVQKKRDELRNIARMGASTLRPIGIGRTMDEIEAEQKKKQAAAATQNEPEPERGPPPEIAQMQILEVDLDQDVVEMDGGDVDDSMFVSEEENGGENDEENDGFMAEEVEYQADHSLDYEVSAPTFRRSSDMRLDSRSGEDVDDAEVSMDMVLEDS
ncbi:hypothetical protein DICA3_A03620 [Diutina catenulata]